MPFGIRAPEPGRKPYHSPSLSIWYTYSIRIGSPRFVFAGAVCCADRGGRCGAMHRRKFRKKKRGEVEGWFQRLPLALLILLQVPGSSGVTVWRAPAPRRRGPREYASTHKHVCIYLLHMYVCMRGWVASAAGCVIRACDIESIGYDEMRCDATASHRAWGRPYCAPSK
jgi:hypothetical protein